MKTSVVKIPSRISLPPDKQTGIICYDASNQYPQLIERLNDSSGRSKSCVDTFAKFMSGDGFADPAFAKSVVGANGLIADKLLRHIAKSLALYRGFALHINFNLLGEITEINPTPFKEWRLSADDEGNYTKKLKHYTDWGKESYQRIRKDLIVEYDEFNPSKAVEQITEAGGIQNYKGQVYYFSLDGYAKYPKATIDPVIEDVASDAFAKEFRLNNLSTNFLAFYFLVTGKCEDDSERDTYKKMIAQFQGADKAGRIIHVEKENDTDTFDLKKADIQDVDGLFELTEKSVMDGIRRPFKIPPVLLGDQVPGKLGTTQQELTDAINAYNWFTLDDRNLIVEEVSKLMQYYFMPVNPSGNYSIKPLQATLTTGA